VYLRRAEQHKLDAIAKKEATAEAARAIQDKASKEYAKARLVVSNATQAAKAAEAIPAERVLTIERRPVDNQYKTPPPAATHTPPPAPPTHAASVSKWPRQYQPSAL
jgi:hypothetical protein